MMETSWGSATDVGAYRRDNEDSYFAEFPIFVVADGMGGHAGGEVASACAVSAFAKLVEGDTLTSDDVRAAIEQANIAVIDKATATAGLEAMGTTVVGLARVVEHGSELWAAFNVGDSRLYRLFDGELQQVSTDHSAVQDLVEAGAITQREARVHPNRNIVTRSIGVDAIVDPDIWLLRPVAGERFLLCSDGLNGDLEDDDIAGILKSVAAPEDAAKTLVERALAAGGRDNITAIVVDTVGITDESGDHTLTVSEENEEDTLTVSDHSDDDTLTVSDHSEDDTLTE